MACVRGLESFHDCGACMCVHVCVCVCVCVALQDWGGGPASDMLNSGPLFNFASRITSITTQSNGQVTLGLERPLGYDLQPGVWNNVQVHRFSTNSMLTEVRD